MAFWLHPVGGQGFVRLQRARAMVSGLGLVWLWSCGAARAPEARAPAPCSAAVASRVGASVAAEERRVVLDVHVRPLPAEAGGVVAVSLELTAGAGEVASLRVPRALVAPLEVKVTRRLATCDLDGAPNVEVLDLRGDPGGTLSLAGLASGEPVSLRLEYQLAPTAVERELWQLDQDRFIARGAGLLVLPEDAAFEADTLIDIDASAYGDSGRAVSSLGLGQKPRASMTLRALRESVFAAGWPGSAVFDAAEGYDEAAWFGSTAFDPRPLAAEVASFRTAVRDLFKYVRPRPLTLILVVERSLPAFEVTRAPASVVARVGLGQPLTPRLRLAIFHQVMKEWIGGQLTVADESGAELVWFTEGICRFLARELAFEFGLLTPLELAEEVNAVMAIQSVLSQEKHRAGCGSPAGERGPLSGCAPVLELARGVLHAGEVDAALRARQSSLLALLAELLSGGARALTLPEWLEALRRAGGAEAVSVQEELAKGRAVVPPSGAFGACFTREPARYTESVLGFDYEPASGEGRAWRVAALGPEAPAFAAGLREGARVRAIEHAPHDPERLVRVELFDGNTVEYRGAEARVAGARWKRVPGIPDERCLSLRRSARGN